MPFFTSALLLRRDLDLERDLCFFFLLLDLSSLLRDPRLRDLLRRCLLERDLDLDRDRLSEQQNSKKCCSFIRTMILENRNLYDDSA